MYDVMTTMDKVTENISFDRVNGMLIRGNTEVSLSEKERLLFSLFLDKKNISVNKDEIIHTVWGTRGVVTTETNLAQLIYRLRRTLLAVGLGSCIKTVPRMGYVFISDEVSKNDLENTFPVNETKKRLWRSITFAVKITSIMILAIILIFPFPSHRVPRRKNFVKYFNLNSGDTLTLERNDLQHLRVNNGDKLTIEVDTPTGTYIYKMHSREKNENANNMDIELVN
ncbi:winged helix-turn-helix domain-containing protein [Enterobacter asburiae]